MIKKLLLGTFLFYYIPNYSQNKQILYNFDAVPQSLMINPGADLGYRFYFGFPLLSGISANIGSSGFSANDLFAKDQVDFNTKLKNLLASTTRNDFVALNTQLEVFSGGFRIRKSSNNKQYVTFGMYQEFDFLTYFPQDIAVLALYGNKDFIGKSFNLADLSLKAELLSVLHLGYHKQVNEKLIVGGRVKLYSSVFNINSTSNSGYIYTVPTNTTVYEQVISSNIELKTSGISGYFLKDSSGRNSPPDIPKKILFNGDLGLGFDLGLTYYPKKNKQITASILDIGIINHTKDVFTYRYKGTFNYIGVNADSINNIQNFQKAIPLDTLYTPYRTFRPIKLNASYQYSFNQPRSETCNCSGQNQDIRYRNAVGAQFFMMTTPREPIAALTGFFRQNFSRNLQLKATYTIDTFSSKNIGLGFSGNLANLNLYLLADNLLEYRDLTKANSLSFQFGLNFVFKQSESN